MPGPLPKADAERRRRNKSTTAKVLTLADKVDAPELPPVLEWNPMTVLWWRDVWASPMAPEYDESDRHGLYMLAMLVDDFWRHPSKEVAAEIRLQRQCFGLTPIDRRRLQWEIDRGEEATERRQGRKKAAGPRAVKDPRVARSSAS